MKMSRFVIIEHPRTQYYTTKFPLYTFPHPITFSPGAAVVVAARILWVGQDLAVSQYVVASFSPAGSKMRKLVTHTHTHVLSSSEVTTTVWRY